MPYKYRRTENKEIVKKDIGRPQIWNNAENLRQRVENYFVVCEHDSKPVTLQGLALYLESNMMTICNYRNSTQEYHKEFAKILDYGKAMCEKVAVDYLMDPKRRNIAGPIFYLTNCFGWKNTQNIHISDDTKLEEFSKNVRNLTSTDTTDAEIIEKTT